MSKPASNNPSGFWKMVLLLIIVGAAALMISPVSADTGVTIAAQGDQSYYLGEKVVFSGHNYDSDSTYLFITGPGTFMNRPRHPQWRGKTYLAPAGSSQRKPGLIHARENKTG